MVEEDVVPDIDLLICIDLSSSTNGVLEKFRENFWKIMGDFTYYKPTPKVRIGFIAFGRPSYGKENKYISIVSNLTYNYDEVAKKVFDIKSVAANGDCYIADLIYSATRLINWSKNESTLKLMYIIGNGSPFLGSADLATVCENARKKGIIINPVHYKMSPNNDEDKKWMNFAESCGNSLSTVAVMQPVVLLKKEYDNRLFFSANAILNSTYVYYGQNGKTAQENLAALDQKATEFGADEIESRILFKASDIYQQKNEAWDLVDLTSQEGIDFLKVDKQFLPEDIREYDSAKLEALLIGKKKEREDAITLINMLSQRRINYLSELKKETEEKIKVDNSLIGILMNTTAKEAQEWGFSRQY